VGVGCRGQVPSGVLDDVSMRDAMEEDTPPGLYGCLIVSKYCKCLVNFMLSRPLALDLRVTQLCNLVVALQVILFARAPYLTTDGR